MASLKRIGSTAIAALFLCGSELLLALPEIDTSQANPFAESQRKIRQTTDVSASPCADIDWSQQTSGVQSVRNRQVSMQTSTENCLILSPGQLDDIAPTINSIPPDTTVYFSTKTSDLSAPAVVDYPVKSPLLLSYHQHLHAAPDSETQKVRLLETDFTGPHMVHLGDPVEFHPSQSGLSVISGLHFVTASGSDRNQVDSILFVECNSQNLQIENNVFHLSSRASIFMDCKLPNSGEEGDRTALSGPGLFFLNNKILGSPYQHRGQNYIPDEGVFINLPLVVDLKDRIHISGNSIEGSMSEAIEVILGEQSSALISNNTINIDTTGNIRSDTEQTHRGGIVLEGRSYVQVENMPVFSLAANQIDVSDTAITLQKSLILEFSCNALSGESPWGQVTRNEAFHAIPTEMYNQLCSSKNVTDGSPRNLWASRNEQKSPCEGLQQYSGVIPFIAFDCTGPLQTPPNAQAIQGGNGSATTILIISIMLITTAISTLANLGVLF